MHYSCGQIGRGGEGPGGGGGGAGGGIMRAWGFAGATKKSFKM